MAALHRELAEELGVRVEVGAELPGPDDDLPGWPLPPAHRMRVWLVRVTHGLPAPIEAHDEVRLLPAGGWLDVGWLPGDVPIVEALVAMAGRMPSDEGTDGSTGCSTDGSTDGGVVGSP